MRVARIRVRNIRSYLDATLDLSPGTTLLVGDVGAGKTSLLYAVELALFGTAEIEATFLVRHGAAEAEVEVTLEDGEHRYEIVRSFRRVRRKGREGFEPGKIAFREDGATTSYSATELRQRVIEILGFRDNPNPRAHSDLWRWAVYVPQEQMRAILSAPPKDRLETVRRALGVERYRLAAENGKEVARELRQTAAALRGGAELLQRFTEEYAAASLELERVELARSGAESRRVALAARQAQSATAVEAAREALHRLDADRRIYVTLQEEEVADRAAVDAYLRARTKRAQEIEETIQEARALLHIVETVTPLRRAAIQAAEEVARARTEVERRASTQGALSTARARVTELERRSRTLGQEQERTREQVDRARREATDLGRGAAVEEPLPPTSETLPELDTTIRSARATEVRAREASTLAQRSVTELQDLVSKGVCPRCGQTVRSAEFGRHSQEAAAAAQIAAEEVRVAEASRENAERSRVEREQYERHHERWAESTRRRNELTQTLTTAEESYRRTETALVECRVSLESARREVEAQGPAEAELAACRELLAQADRSLGIAREGLLAAERAGERAAALGQRRSSLEQEQAQQSTAEATLVQRLEGRRAHLQELAAALAREPEVRHASDETERALRAAQDESRSLADELTRHTTQAESLRERRGRAERGQQERRRLLEAAETTEGKATWLSGGFHDAVLTMEARVLERAQAEFEQAFQRYFAALIDDPDLVAVTDASFSPAAQIRGVWTPAEALSGGERTSLALAYRLALARVVRSAGHLRLDSLLLDEPTDGFSPEQVLSMGQLLEELGLPQVLLVSHERELEAVAQRVVWVEKEGGHSTLRGPGTGSGAGSPDLPLAPT